MDPLAAVLRELRFESVGYRWLEFEPGFEFDFSEPGLCGVHAVEDGDCDLLVRDGPTMPLAPGDVVVLPRGDPHVLRSDRACTILCGAFLVGEAEHPVLGALPHVIAVPRDDDVAAVGPLLELLGAEARAPGAGGEVMMARLSDALVVQALRHYARTASASGWLGALRDPDIARVLAAIHAEPGRAWDLATLAGSAGLSRATFSARFTALLGQPAMRYVTSIRMQRARTLLRDERLTVAAVASRLGYGSEASFAMAFKRVTGQSPGSVRAAAPVE